MAERCFNPLSSRNDKCFLIIIMYIIISFCDFSVASSKRERRLMCVTVCACVVACACVVGACVVVACACLVAGVVVCACVVRLRVFAPLTV